MRGGGTGQNIDVLVLTASSENAAGGYALVHVVQGSGRK